MFHSMNSAQNVLQINIILNQGQVQFLVGLFNAGPNPSSCCLSVKHSQDCKLLFAHTEISHEATGENIQIYFAGQLLVLNC